MQLREKPISSSHRRQAFSLPLALLLASSTTLAQKPSSEANYNWTGAYIGAGGGLGAWVSNSAANFDGFPISSNQQRGGTGGFGTILVY